MPEQQYEPPSGVEMATDASQSARGIWRGFPKYLIWSIAFGFVGGALQPVTENLDRFWAIKLQQGLSGLPFGLLLALLFTFGQNKFNPDRLRPRTWGMAIGSWLLAKVVFVGVLLAVYGQA
jgi:membrane associated rhomboid family serine protease